MKKKVNKKYKGPVSHLQHDEINSKIPANINVGLQFTNESVTPKKKMNKGKAKLVR